MAENLAVFVVSALLLAMVPGPSTAVMIRQTLRAGRGAGLAATLGDKVGLLVWGVSAALGLSALIVTSELAYNALRAGGAVVLLLLGVHSLLAGRRYARSQDGNGTAGQPVVASEEGRQLASSWRIGLTASLANPKGAVFALSFLPQFVPADAPVTATLLVLAVVWAVVDGAWSVALLSLVGRVSLVFSRASVRQRLEQVSGALLIGLAVRVALESR